MERRGELYRADARATGCAGLFKGAVEALLGALGTAAAFLGDAELLAQVTQASGAALDSGFDVFFGDCATDANVHCLVSFTPGSDDAWLRRSDKDVAPGWPRPHSQPVRRTAGRPGLRGTAGVGRFVRSSGREGHRYGGVGRKSSFCQYQFACTCCSERINHAFVLDKDAGSIVEEILAPNRRLKLAGVGIERVVGWLELGRSSGVFHLDTNANENGSY